jgi:hypothetical protein
VFKDGTITSNHPLVAPLPFAGVVEGAILSPRVKVPVGLPLDGSVKIMISGQRAGVDIPP